MIGKLQTGAALPVDLLHHFLLQPGQLSGSPSRHVHDQAAGQRFLVERLYIVMDDGISPDLHALFHKILL